MHEDSKETLAARKELVELNWVITGERMEALFPYIGNLKRAGGQHEIPVGFRVSKEGFRLLREQAQREGRSGWTSSLMEEMLAPIVRLRIANGITVYIRTDEAEEAIRQLHVVHQSRAERAELQVRDDRKEAAWLAEWLAEKGQDVSLYREAVARHLETRYAAQRLLAQYVGDLAECPNVVSMPPHAFTPCEGDPVGCRALTTYANVLSEVFQSHSIAVSIRITGPAKVRSKDGSETLQVVLGEIVLGEGRPMTFGWRPSPS